MDDEVGRREREEEKKKSRSQNKQIKRKEKHFLAYELIYKAKIDKDIPLQFPWNFGSFQISNQLYICGGITVAGAILSKFFSVRFDYKNCNLAPLKHP